MAESTLQMKFPRTRHILNLGAATRDDLIMEAHEALIILQNSGLTVEEKVDGANLGVSINPDSKKLVFQKRGHVIAVNSEPQYAKLQAWGDKYEQQLYHVLGHNKILFGEWMCANHTISYDQLPDWFLAFDVYDKKSGHFLSKADRDTLLSATGIPVIKAVHEGPLTSLGSLVDLLMGTKSAYCTGAVQAEGLYLRADSGSQLECRAKIVHPDFTQALSEVGSHWTKKSIQYNRIRPDLWKQDAESNSDGPSLCCGSEETLVMTQQGIFLGTMCSSSASGATTTTTTYTTCGPSSMPTSGSSVQQQYSVDESQVLASTSNCSLITSPAPAAAAAASKLTQTKNIGLRSSSAAGNTAVHVPVIDSRSTTMKRTSTTAASWSVESDREHGCHVCCRHGVICLVGPAVEAAAQKLQGMVPDNALAKRMEQFGEAHHITLLDPAELSNLLQTHRGCTPLSLSHYNRQKGDVSDVDGALALDYSTTVKHLSDSNDDWKAALCSTMHNSTSARQDESLESQYEFRHGLSAEQLAQYCQEHVDLNGWLPLGLLGLGSSCSSSSSSTDKRASPSSAPSNNCILRKVDSSSAARSSSRQLLSTQAGASTTARTAVSSYFCVVSWPSGHRLRQHLLVGGQVVAGKSFSCSLPPSSHHHENKQIRNQSFHITLGFMPKDVHGASVKKSVHSLLRPVDLFGLKKLSNSVLLSLNSAAILVMQSMDELSQCSSASNSTNSGMASSHHDRHESLASALEASKRLIHTASDILSTFTTTISCQQPHEQGPASVGSSASTASSGGSADTANHKTLLMITDVSDSCDRPETVNGGISAKRSNSVTATQEASSSWLPSFERLIVFIAVRLLQSRVSGLEGNFSECLKCMEEVFQALKSKYADGGVGVSSYHQRLAESLPLELKCAFNAAISYGYVLQGKAFFGLGQVEGAAAAFQQGLDTSPPPSRVLSELGGPAASLRNNDSKQGTWVISSFKRTARYSAVQLMLYRLCLMWDPQVAKKGVDCCKRMLKAAAPRQHTRSEEEGAPSTLPWTANAVNAEPQDSCVLFYHNHSSNEGHCDNAINANAGSVIMDGRPACLKIVESNETAMVAAGLVSHDTDVGEQQTLRPLACLEGPLDPRSRYTVVLAEEAALSALDHQSEKSFVRSVRSVLPGAAIPAGQQTAAVTLPRNTSWLIQGRLMASSTPKSRDQILAWRLPTWVLEW